jgi:hypothetical protein
MASAVRQKRIILKRNTETLKNAQNNKIENVAHLVCLSLFMDGTGKCKLPSTPPDNGLSRHEMVKF